MTEIKPLFDTDDKGRPLLTQPAVFYCGCGTVRPRVERIIEELGGNIEMVTPRSNFVADRFLDFYDVKKKLTQFNASEYAFFCIPTKPLKFINIKDSNVDDTVKTIRKELELWKK